MNAPDKPQAGPLAPSDANSPQPVAPGDATTALRLREDLIAPDPLLDCLIEVCRLHGLGASRASLSAGLPLDKGPLTLTLAERAAARAGLATRVQRLSIDQIDPLTLPAILLLQGNHACVLLGRESDGRLRVLFPETGQGAVTLSPADLSPRYSGVVLFARPHFRFDERTPEVRATRSGHWFWGAVLAQRFVYKDVLWAALLVNLFALAFPLFSMNVYDRVVPNHAVETLWALAVGVVLVLGSDLFMRLLRSHFVDEASARIDVKISARLMESVLGMKLENRPQSVGSFASNLRGFEQVRDFIASSTVTALIDLPFGLLFVSVIAWISPWLVIPVVTVFLIVLVAGYVLQHRLHELSQTTYQASAQRNATLVESLTGIETIKAQGAESVIQSRWERANEFLAATNVKMRGLSSSAMYSTSTLQQLVSVTIVIIGVYLITDKNLTMGGLIAANMLAGRALAPAGQIVGLLMQYQGARTALESLEQIMEKPVERPEGKNFIQRRELKGEIEFRNVSFAQPAGLSARWHQLQDQSGREGGLHRQGGLGQDDHPETGAGPVPAQGRIGTARWHRHAPAGPGRRAPQPGLCLARCDPARCRHPGGRRAARQHHLRHAPRDGRIHRGRRRDGRHDRLRAPPPAGLRHAGGRARRAALGRATPGRGHCPRGAAQRPAAAAG